MDRRVSYLRWSWRDLRARWPQVVAIALIIGVGSGVYSGLSSSSPWRTASYDASFARLNMYDLRVAFDDDVYVDQARLQAEVDGVDADTGNLVASSRARLRVPTQVDASTRDTTVMVPGELVSVGVDEASGQSLNGLDIRRGRALRGSDAVAGAATVAIDDHFADEYDLSVPRVVTLGGGARVEVVSRVLSPEYFMIMGNDGGLLAQANHAVIFAPLPTVQRLSGHDGQVNDMLLRLAPGADRDEVARSLRTALKAAFPQAPFKVMEPTDDPVRTLMYDDIAGDQRFFNIFAVMVLLGAAFAAFNLTGRILQAQRREFGIGMAMGVPTGRLAVRPVLFGAQVALTGVIAGIGLGLILEQLMGALWRGLFPLPVWITEFQPGVFLRGAALGFVIPLLACVLPLRRTLRMAPVDAIRTTHRTPGGGLSRWLVHLPGSTVAQMPFRNVLRAPRRTILTALGIAAAIAVLVGVMGLIDSFMATIDRGEKDILGASPDRMSIDLDYFYPVDSPVVAGATDPSLVTAAETGLRLPGRLGTGDSAFDVLIQSTDFSSDLWRPAVVSGELTEGRDGVVISEKAARDLGVSVGDEVSLRHPVREGLGYRVVHTRLPVLAVHANPYRFLVYVDDDRAGLFGLAGITNSVRGLPVGTVQRVQRAMFTRDGVASVQPVSRVASSLRDRLDETIGLFDVVQVMVLLLTVLIAFNSTSINVDERAREHATMFAFGLPVGRAVWTSVVEASITGALGTIVGLAVGRMLIGWMVHVLIPSTFPDLAVSPDVAPSTILVALALGIGAVAVAPLLTIRKLRTMDLPATLRVVE